jgi:hypothetical protein
VLPRRRALLQQHGLHEEVESIRLGADQLIDEARRLGILLDRSCTAHRVGEIDDQSHIRSLHGMSFRSARIRRRMS